MKIRFKKVELVINEVYTKLSIDDSPITIEWSGQLKTCESPIDAIKCAMAQSYWKGVEDGIKKGKRIVETALNKAKVRGWKEREDILV